MKQLGFDRLFKCISFTEEVSQIALVVLQNYLYVDQITDLDKE